MARSISDIKKTRGRPPKPGGADPGVFVRLPPAVLAALDKYAAKIGATRSEALRQLIEAGLAKPAKKGK
jgi:hypothetical protein